MKSAVRAMTFLILIFIIVSSLGATTVSFIGQATGGESPLAMTLIDLFVDVIAVAIPLSLGYALSRRMRYEREEERGVAEVETTAFGMTREGAELTLAFTMPTVGGAFLIAYLTTLLLGLFGMENTPVTGGSLISMIAIHAAFPALLEELVFRYLPMKLLAPYSKRWCIVFSSIFFALAHINLYQMPTALFAGVVFILIDLAADSVWPSVIMHFVNNTLSVISMKYADSSVFNIVFAVVIGVLSLISVVFIIVRRKKYSRAILPLWAVGEGYGELASPIIFTAFSTFMAVLVQFYS